MQENKPLYYIPNTVQIGCTGTLSERLINSVGRSSDMDKVGLPSCRFMMNKWTDLNLFEKMTGFRPTNMINKEKEIKKMLTGSVFEIENVPTSGFKLVDVQNNTLYPSVTYMSYGKTYAYIYDPRGFVFSILFADFWKSLIKNNISIDSDKTISGKFVYGWYEHTLNSNNISIQLINENDMISTSEYDVKKESDIMDGRKENPGIKANDFVPGTVYDYNNNGQIERVLFVGKYNMYSLKALKEFCSQTFGGSLFYILGSYSRRTSYSYNYPSTYFNEDEYDDFIQLMNKSKKYNVFLTLSAQMSYYHNPYTDMMCINNNPDPNDYYKFSFIHNMKFLNGGVNMIKISDNQDICLDSSISALEIDQSKYQFKTILSRFNDRISKIDKHVEYIKSKFDGKTTEEIIDTIKHLDENEARQNGIFK